MCLISPLVNRREAEAIHLSVADPATLTLILVLVSHSNKTGSARNQPVTSTLKRTSRGSKRNKISLNKNNHSLSLSLLSEPIRKKLLFPSEESST
jgi:hypothetical protein